MTKLELWELIALCFVAPSIAAVLRLIDARKRRMAESARQAKDGTP
jgi:hypothetical protein